MNFDPEPTTSESKSKSESEPITKLRSVNLTVTISQELEEQFLILAASLGCGKSEAVAYCIRQTLASHAQFTQNWLDRKAGLIGIEKEEVSRRSLAIYYKKKRS